MDCSTGVPGRLNLFAGTRTMQNIGNARKAAGSILAMMLCVQSAPADPLHKFGTEGAWRHEGSGWMFPKHIGGFERIGAPYTIDGNDDVGAEYVTVSEGMRRSARVEVYYADSATGGAKLAAAQASVRTHSNAALATELHSAWPLTIVQLRDSLAVESICMPHTGTDNSQSALYFVQTPAWVVTICTTVQGLDSQAAAALDDFVRALRWDTLGSDPGDLHARAP
jgi:hypothetical protein